MIVCSEYNVGTHKDIRNRSDVEPIKELGYNMKREKEAEDILGTW